MALVLGTNCGFVTVAPTDDPAGLSITTDNIARATKHTTAADITKITEIGWWCDNATQASNFEVGLYSHDAINDKPDERLYVDNTNAKGTDAGWKRVTVDWDVTAETTYWIAIQLDNTATTTKTDYVSTPGDNVSWRSATTLENPWGASSQLERFNAIYALVEAGVTYSELSGTIEGTGTPSGNLDIALISELSGTIAGVGAMSGNLGSVLVHISSDINYKRLVVVGSNGFYYEDI